MTENEISNRIIGHALAVHRALGPGLLESAYQQCLYYELTTNGLYVESEKPMPVIYKEIKLDHGYRIDLLVEGKVVIEVKTIEAFADVHVASSVDIPQVWWLQTRTPH